MLPLLALACAGPSGGDPSEDDAPVDVADTADAVESIGDVPPRTRTLDAPGLATLTCAAAIPTDGKTECDVAFAWPDGTEAWAGIAGVGLHGRSSAGFPKPQYAIELREPDGGDAKVALFGLGEEADWLLNGMYVDRALLRNRLAFDLFRELGGAADWAPRTAYVEATVNGDAQGVFLLTERVERGGDRLDYAADAGDGARFVVKADEVGTPSTLQYALWATVEPAAPTNAQAAGIAATLAEVEASIAAGDRALWDRVDLDSFVAFVLVEELLKNNDAYFLSHHLWRGDDGLVRFVPWDLDLTLGQPYYNDNWRSDAWIAYRPDLVALAAAQPAFARRMAERWTEARGDVLADDAVLARMESYRALVGEDAIARNFARWPIAGIQFAGDQLYPVASYEEEWTAVTTWIVARLAWMDQNVGSYATSR